MLVKDVRMKKGDLVWDNDGTEQYCPDTVGIVLDFVQHRRGDEPHVIVECIDGEKVVWDVEGLGNAGSPFPHNGEVIVKWVVGRPREAREHELWPIEMFAPFGDRAVLATDPRGHKHWLILPSEDGNEHTYIFEEDVFWKRLVAQTLKL